MVEETEEEVTTRSNLNLQQFMNDMRMIGEQVRNKDLDKPAFLYGSLEVLTYLNWLILGELMALNDKLNEGEE